MDKISHESLMQCDRRKECLEEPVIVIKTRSPVLKENEGNEKWIGCQLLSLRKLEFILKQKDANFAKRGKFFFKCG